MDLRLLAAHPARGAARGGGSGSSGGGGGALLHLLLARRVVSVAVAVGEEGADAGAARTDDEPLLLRESSDGVSAARPSCGEEGLGGGRDAPALPAPLGRRASGAGHPEGLPPAPPPPPSRTKWTRRVPHPVLTGHVSRRSRGQ